MSSVDLPQSTGNAVVELALPSGTLVGTAVGRSLLAEEVRGTAPITMPSCVLSDALPYLGFAVL
jgi:hypothetical protein